MDVHFNSESPSRSPHCDGRPAAAGAAIKFCCWGLSVYHVSYMYKHKYRWKGEKPETSTTLQSTMLPGKSNVAYIAKDSLYQVQIFPKELPKCCNCPKNKYPKEIFVWQNEEGGQISSNNVWRITIVLCVITAPPPPVVCSGSGGWCSDWPIIISVCSDSIMPTLRHHQVSADM